MGWVGDDCSTTVHPALLDGSDLSAGAGHATLAAGESMCFFAPLGNFPYHLGVAHKLVSGAGPLDLFGLLVPPPTDPPTPGPYPNSTTTYSFVATSVPSKPEGFLTVDQDSAGAGYGGIYLCLANRGSDSATTVLRGSTHSCPFKLDAAGAMSICSSTDSDKRYDGGTCPNGLCTCTGAYARPSHVAVYDGLGFEDCSAAVSAMEAGPEASATVAGQPPGSWHFFSFHVQPEDGFVAATATATANTSSNLELYLRFWQPPGRASAAQHDASTGMDLWHRTGRQNGQDLSETLYIMKGGDSAAAQPQLRPGLWFAGAYVDGPEPVSYSFTVKRSACPWGCSGERGTCQEDGKCKCAKDDYMGAGCEDTCTKGAPAAPYRTEPRAGWNRDMVTVEGLPQEALQGGVMDVVVEATLLAPEAWPAYVTERPVLLLGSGDMEGWEAAARRAVMAEPGGKTRLAMHGRDVIDGTVYAIVINTLSSPYKVGYEVTITTEAHCPGGCSGHGECEAGTGQCRCQDGYAGLDCAVDTSQYSGAACVERSLKREYDVSGGAAYSVCVCQPSATGGAPGPCAFAPTQPGAGGNHDAVLVCGPGYHATGTGKSSFSLSDGTHITAGGVCAHVPSKGVSGAMVFFYCVLSIFLAAGLAFSSRYVVAVWDVYVLPQLQARGYLLGSRGGVDGGYTHLFDGFSGGRNTANDQW